MDIKDQKIPVYRVKKESGKGPVKTLHRNSLLLLHSIPYEDSIPDTKEPPIPRHEETNIGSQLDQGIQLSIQVGVRQRFRDK
ncbi:hypothetical protein DPMN_166026 [Dreissena polymorpha]|uniref:Uncharacterized protein n=1 Tax=Dreissena polymorpha TaxID=45954 RepID=A0A9D4IV49_DREPO|nr:hypothetical protein DPMN_166026 [Dreissena polymorpha]